MSPARAPGRPVLRLVTMALLLLGGLALTQTAWAPTASAHDVLEQTSPADGATVGRLPDKVTLTFDSPALALGTELQVTGPSGQVQQGKPVLVDNTVSQALAPGSPAGKYTVVWRVTSEDGHPVSGTFHFTATKGSAGAAPTTTTEASSPPSSTAARTPSAGQSSSPAAASTASSDDAAQGASGSTTPWIIAVVVVLIILGGLVAWRRRPHGG